MEYEQEDKKGSKKDKESIIKAAKKCFKDAEEKERDNKDRGLEDIRFARLGDQWPQQIKRDREKDGRPCLTINVMPSNIRQVVNDARENKPSIKVHPVDDNADVETAQIYDGLFRHIEANSRADIAYDTAIDNSCSANIGYIRVNVDYIRNDSFEQEILIDRVANPLTIYGDPYSDSADGSGWNKAFVTEMIEEGEFKRRYPKADKSNFEFGEYSKGEETWFEDKSIRVAEYWVRDEVKTKIYLLDTDEIIDDEKLEGTIDIGGVEVSYKDYLEINNISIVKERESSKYKVKQYILTAKEILEENEWAGQHIPIVPVYGEEVNENGKTHYFSLIHHAKDAQRNKNYWRTCATEQVALASKTPWVGPKGFARSDPNWDTANTENHPYLEAEVINGIMPQRQPFPGIPAGALQEAANATDDIKSILGLYDASLGAKSNETSGKAINARKREGDTSTFHFIDNLSRAIRQVGLIVLDLIPKVYGEKQIIRILGEDGTASMIPMKQDVVVSEQGYLPAQQAQQQGIQGLQKVFDLTVGRYDLTVSAGPSYTSRREETAVRMTEFIRSFPQAAPIIGDLLAKNLDWPGAQEIAERLKTINPALQRNEQKPDPEMMKAKADMDKVLQEAQIQREKGQVDIALKQIDLELKKMELLIKKQEADNQAIKSRAEIEKIEIESSNQQRMEENNNYQQ